MTAPAANPCRIRAARPGEAADLSAPALRAKAHWGYPQAFMDACRAELSYDGKTLAAGDFFVVERDGHVAGFAAIEPGGGDSVELVALFLEPEHIGAGLGRRLPLMRLDLAQADETGS